MNTVNFSSASDRKVLLVDQNNKVIRNKGNINYETFFYIIHAFPLPQVREVPSV
jgi:hypothetical protein